MRLKNTMDICKSADYDGNACPQLLHSCLVAEYEKLEKVHDFQLWSPQHRKDMDLLERV